MNLTEWIVTDEASAWRREMPSEADGTGHPLALGRPTGPAFKGFGGCFNELGWTALRSLPEPAREEVLAMVFGDRGCRFRRNRMPIGASDYAESWYSLDEHDGDFDLEHFSTTRDEACILQYVSAARRHAPDMTVFLSPWSPPAWMKHPKVCNYGRLVDDPRFHNAYARYLLRSVTAFQALGVPVDQLHIQNEVLADQKFPSCQWSGEALRDFVRDHLGPCFEAAGYPAELWLGTINGPFTGLDGGVNDYANRVLLDDGARRHLRGVGYQWAGKNAIRRTLESWPDMPVMQTENECGDGENTWLYARYVFELVRHYLVEGAEAYVYWNPVLDAESKGMSSWGWRQNSMISIDAQTGTYRVNPEYHVMRHFAAFIGPGARRIELTGRWASNAVAFADTRGTVVALMNPFPEQYTVVMEGRRFLLPPHSVGTAIFEAEARA